jgi:hypothetical protein
MKAKNVGIALVMATFTIVNAQPFNGGLFGAGKVLSLGCDTTGVSEGPSGANVTWTVPLIVKDTINSDAQTLAAASTPYFAKFPSATGALLSTGSITEYTYYRLANDSLVLLGYADSLQTVAYFNPELLDVSALTFGNSFTDTFGYRDTTTVSTLTMVSKIDGTRTVMFDGSGTLVLPWINFSHAMRFKSVTTQTDSSWFGTILTSTSKTTTTNFSWEDTTLPKNTSFSISRTTTTISGISIANNVVTFIEPMPSTVIAHTGHRSGKTAISVMFSQFDNSIAIRAPSAFGGGKVSFIAYDLNGKVVAREQLRLNVMGLANSQLTNRLSKGVYLYSLKTGEGILGQGKMVVR